MADGISGFSGILFLILICVDVWCLTNAGILIRWLWPSRRMSRSVQAMFEVMCAVALVAASILLMLSNALVYPQEEVQPASPAWLQGLVIGAFVAAHIGLAIASHRARVFFMYPTKKDRERPLIGKE